MGRYLDLFFHLGVIFLVLKTRNVTQFALRFGSTSFVNTLVFLGILLTVLLAVSVCRHAAFRRPARLNVVQFAALVVALGAPTEQLVIALRHPPFSSSLPRSRSWCCSSQT